MQTFTRLRWQTWLPGRKADGRRQVAPCDGRPAFTLIELLVVIAVITILASLLLPGLNRAKVSTRSAVCKSNLRQIGIAIASYVGDFNAYPMYVAPRDIPPPWAASFSQVPAVGTSLHWFEALKPFAGDIRGWSGIPGRVYYPPGTPLGRGRFAAGGSAYQPGLFVCPDYYGPVCYGEFSEDDLFNFNPGADYSGAYGYNATGMAGIVGGAGLWPGQLGLGGSFPPGSIGDWPTPRFYLQPCREAAVVNPAEMRAVADAILTGGRNPQNPSRMAFGNNWINVNVGGGKYSFGRSSASVAMEKRRHNDRFNSVYCDGHVDSLRRAQFFDWQHIIHCCSRHPVGLMGIRGGAQNSRAHRLPAIWPEAAVG
jgi:prepilin-type N-terminal cleavage/methylation domain-containing protein/prepilin-type processing-associated H-X9-DG protein